MGLLFGSPADDALMIDELKQVALDPGIYSIPLQSQGHRTAQHWFDGYKKGGTEKDISNLIFLDSPNLLIRQVVIG